MDRKTFDQRFNARGPSKNIEDRRGNFGAFNPHGPEDATFTWPHSSVMPDRKVLNYHNPEWDGFIDFLVDNELGLAGSNDMDQVQRLATIMAANNKQLTNKFSGGDSNQGSIKQDQIQLLIQALNALKGAK